MTRFTVVWQEDARGELAELWMASADRNEITTAADTIDQLLAVDPEKQGSELREGLFSLKLLPLKILFLIREQDRIVEVLAVAKV